MFKEASRICSWVIRIYRTLVEIDKEVYTPHLVLSLFNLSWLYHDDHNLEAAHEAITESVGIGWSLHMSTSRARQGTFQSPTFKIIEGFGGNPGWHG